MFNIFLVMLHDSFSQVRKFIRVARTCCQMKKQLGKKKSLNRSIDRLLENEKKCVQALRLRKKIKKKTCFQLKLPFFTKNKSQNIGFWKMKKMRPGPAAKKDRHHTKHPKVPPH